MILNKAVYQRVSNAHDKSGLSETVDSYAKQVL